MLNHYLRRTLLYITALQELFRGLFKEFTRCSRLMFCIYITWLHCHARCTGSNATRVEAWKYFTGHAFFSIPWNVFWVCTGFWVWCDIEIVQTSSRFQTPNVISRCFPFVFDICVEWAFNCRILAVWSKSLVVQKWVSRKRHLLINFSQHQLPSKTN